MKKIFLVLFIIFISITWANAESNFENDYTLIDCIEWNDDIWIPFNSNMPFQSLKSWIENSIWYINSDINISWNEESASWKVLNIKVKCSASNILDSIINLWFKWTEFNNKLIIEWIWDNWLVIQNTKFKILKWAWNIVFKNAKFENEYNNYFEDEVFNTSVNVNHPTSYWITILDSYIKLNNTISIWNSNSYNNRYIFWYNRLYTNFSNYTNKQKIINSQIDINIDWDYNFKMPFYLKDSKINFINESWTWVYNISFSEDWNINNLPKVDYAVFVSNEIDMWWNNISVENDSDIWFINNKFLNFNEFNFWWWAIFFNNSFENILDIDISLSHYLLNNIFKSTFTDTFDKYNLRKNYQNNEVWEKWIWWIFKRNNSNDFFNIDLSSTKLYKEITWIDIEWLYNSIYVIFTK